MNVAFRADSARYPISAEPFPIRSAGCGTGSWTLQARVAFPGGPRTHLRLLEGQPLEAGCGHICSIADNASWSATAAPSRVSIAVVICGATFKVMAQRKNP